MSYSGVSDFTIHGEENLLKISLAFVIEYSSRGPSKSLWNAGRTICLGIAIPISLMCLRNISLSFIKAARNESLPKVGMEKLARILEKLGWERFQATSIFCAKSPGFTGMPLWCQM